MYKKLIIPFCVIITLSLHTRIFAQDENYGYKNWPGKNSIAKNKIEIDDNLVSNYKMSLAKGYNDSSLFYKIRLNEGDSLKKGRLQIKIFSSTSEAQLALAEYLDCLAMPTMLPRISSGNFKYGDIAFGKEYDGIIQLAYTRNNVLVVLHAPTEKALLLANEIDLRIQNAPELRAHTHKPSLLFTK